MKECQECLGTWYSDETKCPYCGSDEIIEEDNNE